MENANKSNLCIGDRLKKFRETFLNLSQSALAKELGCSQQKINQIENGTQQELKFRDVIKLAEMGLNIHWLYTGKGNMLYSKQSFRKQAQAVISVLETFVE